MKQRFPKLVSSVFQVAQYLLDLSFVLDEESMYEASLRIEPKVPNWWGIGPPHNLHCLFTHQFTLTISVLYSCTWLRYLFFCTVDVYWHKFVPCVFLWLSFLLLPWCQLLWGFFLFLWGTSCIIREVTLAVHRCAFIVTNDIISIILYSLCTFWALVLPIIVLFQFYWWLSFSANNVAL